MSGYYYSDTLPGDMTPAEVRKHVKEYYGTDPYNEARFFQCRARVYDSFDEGNEDMRDYDGYAFRYYEPKETKTMQALRERINREQEKLAAYKESHHVRNHKSKYVGCKNCGSRINTDYVMDQNVCPCCGASLYSDTDRSTIKRYVGNISTWTESYDELSRGKKARGELKWYVHVIHH